MKRQTIPMLLALAALALSGCQSVKKELGVGRNSPDEFAVVKRAPLSMPPDYTLRAPETGEAPAAAIASNQAKTIVLGKPAAEPATDGSADSALLQKLGTQNADPLVREKISEENGYIALENQKLVDKLIFWKEPDVTDADLPASQVDAAKEAERIKQNEKQGAPVTQGDTPVVEEKKGTIDKIF